MNRPYVAVSKSPSRAVFLTGNKAQVILYIDGWKDLLSSVSLFGLEVLLPLVDDCSYEIWWSGTGELTLNHQTRWLTTSRRQCGRPLLSLCCTRRCRSQKICGWFEAPCMARGHEQTYWLWPGNTLDVWRERDSCGTCFISLHMLMGQSWYTRCVRHTSLVFWLCYVIQRFCLSLCSKQTCWCQIHNLEILNKTDTFHYSCQCLGWIGLRYRQQKIWLYLQFFILWR